MWGMPVEKVALQKKKVGFLFIRSKLSAFVPISIMLTFNIMRNAKRRCPKSPGAPKSSNVIGIAVAETGPWSIAANSVP